MAKKHKNLENIKIQWNGDLSHPEAGNKNQSIPANINLGAWNGGGWWSGDYVPDYDCPLKQTNLTGPQCYWEDYNLAAPASEDLNIADILAWSMGDYNWPSDQNKLNLVSLDVPLGYLSAVVAEEVTTLPPKAYETKGTDQSEIYSDWNGFVPNSKTYTWGDVSFLIEIADGIGTGSRRARETRLNQFEQEKKKRLIRLICRVKGEKVYDEEKEMGDTYIKLEDADLVINEVLGKMRVENANVL